MPRPSSIVRALAARATGGRRPRRARRRRASALLVVLWVSVAASALFFASTKGAVAEIKRQKAALNAVTAEAAARGGIEKARYLLATFQPATNSPDPFSALDQQDSFAPSDIDGARYFLLSETSGDALATGLQTPGNAAPAIGLVDLSGRLNLNTATLAAIEQLPNMTPDLAAAIMDFRNPAGQTQTGGAPSSYYQGLPIPYQARNAPLESLSELLLVRGMTPAILYGEDRNLNGILDANENDGSASFPPDDADGVLDRGLYPFVTLTSASPGHPAGTAGTDWINLNTADLTQITSFLGTRVSQNALFFVARTIYPSGPRGARRTLTSLGDLVRAFPEFASQYKADLASIFKYCAVTQNAVTNGLIDVNAAPQEVLKTLPAIDDGLATAIIAEREAGGVDFSTACWLLDVPGITPQIFAGLAPLVAARCSYYGVDCVGASADGSTWARVCVAVDASASGMSVTSFEAPDATGGKPVDLKTVQEAGWTAR